MKAAIKTGVLFAIMVWSAAAPMKKRGPGSNTGFPRIDLRTFTDVRINRKSNGLARLFLCTCPSFYLTDYLFVGAH